VPEADVDLGMCKHADALCRIREGKTKSDIIDLCFVIEVLGHIQDVRKVEGGVEFLLPVVLHVELEPV
jgi:hypothetical protein